jgi:V/A-type H+/Na+-transporting ATPase subunit C
VRYDYGNTRLRAMRARLLDRDAYRALLGAGTIENLLGALADTPYGDEVRLALTRRRGLACLDAALTADLAGTLRRVRGFYDGEEGHRVGLLLTRWDARNLRTIIRAQARVAPADEVIPLLVPAGNLDAVALAELARRPGLRAVIDQLVLWDVPSRATARDLLHAWPDYDRTGDATFLEHVVDRAFAASVVAAAGGDAPAAHLAEEIDRGNLLTALRVRGARLRGEVVAAEDLADRYLPGGIIPLHRLDALVDVDDAAAVVTLLTTEVPSWWLEALGDWVAGGDLVTLTVDLDAASTRRAVRRFWSGDPLGIDVPVAYIAAKENEVRNLRFVGRGLVHGLLPEEIEQGLVVAA